MFNEEKTETFPNSYIDALTMLCLEHQDDDVLRSPQQITNKYWEIRYQILNQSPIAHRNNKESQ